MEYIGFEIKNFKGIEHIVLNLSSHPVGPVVTLVGLNESGKTTVLEAISYFDTNENHLEHLYEEEFRQGDVNELVPLKKKANFNGNVEVIATIALDEKDVGEIARFAEKTHGLKINEKEIGDRFTIARRLRFENSIYKNTQNLWTINLKARFPRGQKEWDLIKKDKTKWLDIINHVASRLPSILYFPTFLFEFPSRIYLNDGEEESITNAYYCSIVQDILDSLDDGLNIEEHIVERALDGGIFKRRSLGSVLNRMGNAVSRTVFERWNEIFDKKIPRKDIQINYEVEAPSSGAEEDNRVYLEFELKDGDSIYLITERSLGFRWFFCFLLFTQFRSYRKAQRNTLFLFDEPASNLHSKAQIQLLESFAKITEYGGRIIYSTHSPYMINPRWLENAFIVRNDGLKYEQPESDYEYSSRETNIKVERYRSFVGRNPDKETYFQPILDILDYVPNNLEYIPDAVMVEGKNDFYLLKYFGRALSGDYEDLKILPGSGSGALDSLISLYLGWGRNFLVLLDDDAAGRKELIRYQREWFLGDGRVFTLGAASTDWNNLAIDGLINEVDRVAICEEHYSGKAVQSLTKKDVCRALQEKLLRGEECKFSRDTLENFRLLLEYLDKAIKKK
ncbi:MAG: ATP-binding protein [Candidatus Thiodiazotropha sp. (ex Monitilora ramsayi)]|nr:ATP-binding protein [Candidatus Thiodiazotropha sp. (ex Monitilora ramsayi)]